MKCKAAGCSLLLQDFWGLKFYWLALELKHLIDDHFLNTNAKHLIWVSLRLRTVGQTKKVIWRRLALGKCIYLFWGVFVEHNPMLVKDVRFSLCLSSEVPNMNNHWGKKKKEKWILSLVFRDCSWYWQQWNKTFSIWAVQIACSFNSYINILIQQKSRCCRA